MTVLDLARSRGDPIGLSGVEVPWLGTPGAHDPDRVGGKAANLSRLAARWPVPAGFCLPADVHRRLEQAGADRSTCKWSLRRLVGPAYRRLGGRALRRPPVAVRSSAIDEDTSETSFAGQHDTVLNAVGTRSVVEAVVACSESTRTATVRQYRDAHGLDGTGDMAVLVQKLVDADVSGVAFSANPITGARDEVLVNASFGLGQSVVDGLVTPDTYVVSHQPLKVTDRHIADKDIAVVRGRSGTRSVDLAVERRRQPCLDDARCTEIARMTLQLADEMGWPTDVEFAYAADTLHLLQCRPITTLPTF